MQCEIVRTGQGRECGWPRSGFPLRPGWSWGAVDLSASIRRAIDESGLVDRGRTIRLSIENGCLIWGEEAFLQSLLRRILDNAVKFGDRGTEIGIALWSRDNVVVIAIEDEGQGERLAETERAFRPYLCRDTLKRIDRDCNAGFAYLATIVAAHCGEFRVQGEPGRGTAIEIEFKKLQG